MLKRGVGEVVLDVLEIVATQDLQAFGLVLLADGLVLPLQLLQVAEDSEVEPGDLWQDGGELVEADGVGEEDVHTVDVLVTQVEHPLHPLRQLLHDGTTGAVGVPLGSDEDGVAEPGRWLSPVTDDFLSDLVQCALLLHDEQSAAGSFHCPQRPEAAHVGDQLWLAGKLCLVDVQRDPSQQQAATGADDAQVLTLQADVEGQQFDVVVDEAVMAVVVDEFVVEVALGDELLLLHQRPHHLSDLQQPRHRPDGAQTHRHPALPTVLVAKRGEVESLGVGVQGQLEGLADDAVPNLLLEQ